MRLTLTISDISTGGAQRVMSILANYWAKRGWQITLLTMNAESEKPFYDLHPAITYRPLGIAGDSSNIIQLLRNNFTRIAVLRKAIKSSAPHVVISFMERMNILVYLSILKLNLPIFVCQHSNPGKTCQSGIWKFLRNFAYGGATRLIVLTQSAQSYFSPAIQQHTVVIPNPLFIQDNGHEEITGKDTGNSKKTLIAMGRMDEDKGFDILLKAFAKVFQKQPEWSLVIWGDGPLLSSLKKLRDELGLGIKVRFPGVTRQPYEKFGESDLFVLSSRTEAFPMVLLEAMACGLPVISYDCPSGGAREIIREGIDGILVPPEDIDALSKTLDDLMSDKEKRDRLAKRAPEVIERFGLEKIMIMWEKIIFSAKNA